MKQFFQGLWISLCFLFSIFYLISACSQFIPSTLFSPIVFFSIGFPYLFVIMALLAASTLFIHKKAGLLLLLLWATGLYNVTQTFAFHPGSGWQASKQPRALRILTWNVADFLNAHPLNTPVGSKRRQMLEMITDYHPDVMCLHEYSTVEGNKRLVSVQQELDSLGYKYIFHSNDMTSYNRWGNLLRGVAICSKTPFADTGSLHLQNYWHPETMLYADLSWQGKKIRVATAHLFSFFLFPDSAYGYDGERRVMKKLYYYKDDIQKKMRDIELLHQQQATTVRRALQQSPYPVVYCGDMNAVPTSYTYRLLKDGRQDAFLKKGFGIGATFYKILPTLRIDVCLPDKALQVLQCEVAEKKLSDHYAVVTDVQWNDE